VVWSQLERQHDNATLLLFQGVVRLSRSLRTCQDRLVAITARDLQTFLSSARDSSSSSSSSSDRAFEQRQEELELALEAGERQRLAVLLDLAVALNNLGSVLTAREEYAQAEVRPGG
jgi:hypothetical protein